jgi:hypothetical protein
MKMRAWFCGLMVACGAFGATVAGAHHSYAMFDGDKVVVVRGTLLSFQYINPHSWISVVVPAGTGIAEGRWDIETTSPASLSRMGINGDIVKPGDKVVVAIRPLRDGRRGGAFVLLVDAHGKLYGAKPEELNLRLEDLQP